jgi:hypothetical protein
MLKGKIKTKTLKKYQRQIGLIFKINNIGYETKLPHKRQTCKKIIKQNCKSSKIKKQTLPEN